MAMAQQSRAARSSGNVVRSIVLYCHVEEIMDFETKIAYFTEALSDIYRDEEHKTSFD